MTSDESLRRMAAGCVRRDAAGGTRGVMIAGVCANEEAATRRTLQERAASEVTVNDDRGIARFYTNPCLVAKCSAAVRTGIASRPASQGKRCGLDRLHAFFRLLLRGPQ